MTGARLCGWLAPGVLRLLLASVALTLVACAGKDCENATSFTVMTFNVGDCCASHPTRQKLVNAIRELSEEGNGPDVLLLQEFRQARTQAELQDLGAELGYNHTAWTRSGQDTKARLVIFSRFALSRVRVVKFAASPLQRVALAVDARVANGDVLLVNVHFDHFEKERTSSGDVRWTSWPMLRQIVREVVGNSVRSRMAGELKAWLRRQGAGHVVVGGDLNTVPWSGASRVLEGNLDDALWPSGEFFRGTYTRVRAWVQPRVDFLFHTSGLTAVDGRVREVTLGDHRPVQSGFIMCPAH